MSGVALIGTLYKNERDAETACAKKNRQAHEDRYCVLEIADGERPGMWMVISKQQLNGANL